MSLSIFDFTVNARDEPIGVVGSPVFSWKLRSDVAETTASSYRLRLRNEREVVWDSGTVDLAGPRHLGEPSTSCSYAGPELLSCAKYTVDLDVQASTDSVSASTSFVAGPPKEWFGAKWIRDSLASKSAPVFGHQFELSGPVESAYLFVSAGGYAHVKLNGTVTTPDVLYPGITDYSRRIQYVGSDVTPLIRGGANSITAEVGRSFFAIDEPNIWNWDEAPWHGSPSVLCLLIVTFADGRTETLSSGDDWWVEEGPTTYNDLYGGESFDARLADPDEPAGVPSRRQSCEWDGPPGVLEPQTEQPIRVISRTSGRVISAPAAEQFVVEFPAVTAGWVEIIARGHRGHQIQLVYGEKLLENGLPNNTDDLGYYSGRFQTDEFTLAGTGSPETWSPKFGWKGFKYVWVTGWQGTAAELEPSLVACEVHTDLARTGHFQSSSAMLNQLHEMSVRTILNNMHGIPTDTPKYEKNGWTGDGMVSTEMFLLNLDAVRLLSRWVVDIDDSRHGRPQPSVIAPDPGWTMDWSPTPTWHSAYILIPWWIYEYSGNLSVFRRFYDDMKKYVDFEFERSDEGISDSTLGDWVSPETPPGGGNPDEDRRVIATIYLFAMLDCLARGAFLLGIDSEADDLRKRAEYVRVKFLEAFFDSDQMLVRSEGDTNYRQSYNALAVGLKILPETFIQGTVDCLAHDVRERDFHLNTGVLATKYLLPVLSDYGYTDVAYAVATQTTYPSWGYWMANGATTIWEHWALESRSRNHYALGTADEWFYKSLAGLGPAGLGSITLRPKGHLVLRALDSNVETPSGPLSISLEWVGGDLIVDVECPPGLEVTLELGAPRGVRLSDLPAIPDAVRTRISRSNDLATVSFGSGRYRGTFVGLAVALDIDPEKLG